MENLVPWALTESDEAAHLSLRVATGHRLSIVPPLPSEHWIGPGGDADLAAQLQRIEEKLDKLSRHLNVPE